MVKEIKPEKQALLSKGSGKGSGEGRVDIQVTAGQVSPNAELAKEAGSLSLTKQCGQEALCYYTPRKSKWVSSSRGSAAARIGSGLSGLQAQTGPFCAQLLVMSC